MLERRFCCAVSSCFFFNDTPTPDIYTLSLHDALPIFVISAVKERYITRSPIVIEPFLIELPPTSIMAMPVAPITTDEKAVMPETPVNDCATLRSSRCRSEEHTSELQSHSDLVCRLLLE